VTIHPYFKVSEGKLGAFRELCERFVSKTSQEPKCIYYGFSLKGDEVHCREGYEDAAGLLAHLDNVAALLGEALKLAEITRLEIHGTEEELAQLRGPLANLNPTYFTLEYGFRR
jgi:quinol monooxygenase YgiN